MVTVTADGTFYIGWDIDNAKPLGSFGGGIAISKSTDGGLTWSQPVIAGTPIDRPWLVSDLSTGTLYEASGSPPANGTLGPFSTGDPSSPVGNISDRWIVASQDGIHWTTPQRLGGGGVPGFSITGGNMISAANGLLAATFRSTSGPACSFFVSAPAPCTVFQTTTYAQLSSGSGVIWTRHAVPVPPDSTGTIMVAADPTQVGHYTLAVLNKATTQFLVYQTSDSGTSWRGPTLVAEDATKAHFKPWMNYSPQGVVGLMWRTNQGGGAYDVWAATSDDGGATFSQPLRISSANSPGQAPTTYQGLDDTSFISLDRQDAFIGWADWRPGERSGYIGIVKLQAFTHAR